MRHLWISLLLISCGEYPSYLETDNGDPLWLMTPAGVEGDAPRLQDAVAFWPCLHQGAGPIHVEVGYLPDPMMGYSSVLWDRDTGEIVSCDVIVSVDIAYHHDTVEAVLIHELGHCLGLADDPGHESIMASPPGWILRPEDEGACDVR